MSQPGENLALVLRTWAEVLRTGSAEALADIMAEDIVWQGLRPELVCHGRKQTMGNMRSQAAALLPRVTRMEAEELGDRVVVTVGSAVFPEGPAGPDLSPAGGDRSIVFTFHDGEVARMESYPSRDAARRAATEPVA